MMEDEKSGEKIQRLAYSFLKEFFLLLVFNCSMIALVITISFCPFLYRIEALCTEKKRIFLLLKNKLSNLHKECELIIEYLENSLEWHK